MADPDADAAGRRVVDVAVRSDARAPAASAGARIDLFQEAGARGAVVERAFDVALSAPSQIRVALAPVAGPAVLCGLVVEPVIDGPGTDR
jgi:hypothetical protein